MSAHTPGPWRVEYEPYCHIRSDAGCVLAADYTTEANAHLIAAAPELLDALKLARDIIGHPDDAGSKLINAAIAKAEGQS